MEIRLKPVNLETFETLRAYIKRPSNRYGEGNEYKVYMKSLERVHAHLSDLTDPHLIIDGVTLELTDGVMSESELTEFMSIIYRQPIEKEGIRTAVCYTRIPDMGFSVRTRNALEAKDIRTVEDLLKLSEVELLSLPNIGATTLQEIKSILERYHLRLGELGDT